MPTMQSPPAENPARAKLYAALSFLIALGAVGLSFLPYGYGFLTVFVVVPGVILSGLAVRYGAPRAGHWAGRANMLPIIVYVGYMVTYLPETATAHVFHGTVTEAGVLADQTVFDKKVQAAGAISGIRMVVEPCEHEFLIRVTAKANNHLGLWVPGKPTRECLAQVSAGERLAIHLTTTQRTLTSEIKGYKITQIGDCPLEDTDMGAILQSPACPGWF
jgi:hypothetical protein